MKLHCRVGRVIAVGFLGAALALGGSTATVAQPTLKQMLEPSSKATGDTGAATNGAGTGVAPTAGAEAPSAKTASDEDSPRAAFERFQAAVDAGNFEQAGRSLDLAAVPAARRRHGAATLARELAVVLNRSLWVDPADLSGDPNGDTQDGLPAGRDRVGTITTSSGSVDVLLERVHRNGASQWVFSAATVAQVPALYRELGDTYLTSLLPPFFFEVQFLDLQLWQWLAVLLLAGGAYLAALLGSALLIRVLTPLTRRARTRREACWPELPARCAWPSRVMLFSAGIVPIGLPVVARALVAALAQGVLIIAFTWLVLRLLDLLAEWAAQALVQRGQTSASALVPPAERWPKSLIVGLAVVAILDNFGFNVTAVIAGLGIGGIAIALAAQKSIENLFGGDHPVRRSAGARRRLLPLRRQDRHHRGDRLALDPHPVTGSYRDHAYRTASSRTCSSRTSASATGSGTTRRSACATRPRPIRCATSCARFTRCCATIRASIPIRRGSAS